MTNKIKPHPNGGKHTWIHQRNVELRDERMHRDGSSSLTIRYRGRYICDCGAAKVGQSK